MKKNLDPSFLTSLSDGAYYPGKSQPKQPQVCIKNCEVAANSSFREQHRNFRGLVEPPIINIFQKYI